MTYYLFLIDTLRPCDKLRAGPTAGTRNQKNCHPREIGDPEYMEGHSVSRVNVSLTTLPSPCNKFFPPATIAIKRTSNKPLTGRE
jgi:hypothetical protein